MSFELVFFELCVKFIMDCLVFIIIDQGIYCAKLIHMCIVVTTNSSVVTVAMRNTTVGKFLDK